ncbi:hypothetical protein SADUNF_Sadunf15G0041000 [Salix dunnii]|uniref:Uncharacterized protein n=1 Tax=Salix dunnii TaxID=1413687 RepID=A0A835JBZ0_9ROSI|nr:hypothetical protein SADUNF_Sadunf15G0041000 [Salix dunnii]
MEDLSYYHGIVGALEYHTLTRPNILFLYAKGTIEIGLHFSSHTTLDLFDFSEGALQRDDPLLDIVHSLEEILYLGVQKHKTQFRGQAQKQNIVQWLTQQ